MDPGAYPEPLARTTWVQVPMVSGYVGSRLRVADYAYGTTTGAPATFPPDNRVRLLIQNTVSGSSGTNVYFQVFQTFGTQLQYPRASITAEYGIVPHGRQIVDFTFEAPILEIKCTGGGGNIRAQISSHIKWEEMAFDKYDAFYPQSLWAPAKHPIMGGPPPSPFPVS